MTRTAFIPALKRIAYYLTGELHDKALYPRTAEDYRKLNFRYLKWRVTRILCEGHTLEIDNQSQLTYDRLLIAGGAQAIMLIPVDRAREMKDLKPDALLVVIPTAAHMPMMEYPIETAAAFRGFN